MVKTWMIVPVIALSGFLLSCNIINPHEDKPAYIKVDTVIVKVTSFAQGSASQKMTCVKLYVAETSIGFFQMPTLIPSLTTGLQSIRLDPAIDLNGISGSRVVYPFFKSYIADETAVDHDTTKINLVPGQVVTLIPKTTYKKECKFPWIEDFEDAGVSFLYATYSDTIFRTQNETVREGRYSGAIYMDSVNRFFEAFSSTDFVLPKTGSTVLLEFDYQCNTILEVGMYIIEDDVAVWQSLVYVRPINHWNRIYVDLNTTTAASQTADLFRPGFRVGWDSTGAAKQAVIMDNLKLIHF